MDIPKKRKIHATEGFTLVETLIYLALLGLALSSFLSFGLSISALRNKTNAMEAVISGTRQAADTISQKIREAQSVESPSRGEASDVLRLIMPDGSAVTFATSSETGILTMTVGDSDAISAAPADLVFPVLSFANFGEAGTKDSIQIKMTVKHRNENSSRDFDYSQDYQTTVDVKDKI